jgi:solute carrier family 45 protein 1/2/4
LTHELAAEQLRASRALGARAMRWDPELLRAYFVSVGFAGVLCCWAVQGGRNGAVLRELGMPSSDLGLAWLAGPISGALVQLLVGVLSDRCTSSLGRRRPFIILGSALSVLSLLLFSNASTMGMLLGDDVDRHPWGLFLAIVSFWLLDASINVLQGPMRALLADVVDPAYLATGNSLFSLHAGIGKVIGYSFSAACSMSLPVLAWIGSSTRNIYGAAALVMSITSAVTVLGTHESVYSPPPGPVPETSSTCCSRVSLEATSIKKVLAQAPPAFAVTFAINFFAVFGRFAAGIYSANWMGEQIFGGDPSLEKVEGGACEDLGAFERGVSLANKAMVAGSCCTILWSCILPLLMRRFNPTRLLGAHLLLFSGLLFSTSLVAPGNFNLAFAIIAAFGIPKAAMDSIPWVIVTRICGRGSSGGKVSSLFNLSGCFSDVAMAILSGPIIMVYGLSAAFTFAGVLVSAGMVICFLVPVTWIEHDGSYSTLAAHEHDGADEYDSTGLVSAIEIIPSRRLGLPDRPLSLRKRTSALDEEDLDLSASLGSTNASISGFGLHSTQ